MESVEEKFGKELGLFGTNLYICWEEEEKSDS